MENPIDATAAEESIAKGSLLAQLNNRFAIEMLKNLENLDAQKNQIVSPLSIESALLMTLEGARGRTASEMCKTLGFPATMQRTSHDSAWDLTAVRSEMKELNSRLHRANRTADKLTRGKLESLRQELAQSNTKANGLMRSGKYADASAVQRKSTELAKQINELAKTVDQYDLCIANSIWIANQFNVNPEYVGNLRQHYSTAVEIVDFSNTPDVQRERINQWVSVHTGQKIAQLLVPGTITAMTRMAVANAVYFRGVWAEPFDESQTTSSTFFAQGKTKVTVPTMSKYLESGRYAAFNHNGTLYATPRTERNGAPPGEGYPKDGLQVVELDYNGDEISMVVLLPSQHTGLAKLIQSMTFESLDRWLNQMDSRDVTIKLPKFKQETSYDLSEVLRRQGTIAAFDANAADFSGISSEGIYISKIAHKAIVEVNEQGTEAAAATAVIMNPTSAAICDVPFIPEFRADHPFLFLIRNRNSGLILFLGKVESP